MTSRIEHIIVGGGEMGERMRAFDWTATPLGPVERWPQSLRSAVSILLPSRAQIILFWGPDLVAIYNDAYRPVFGAKHPWALGRPARECWAEVWDVLRPLFEGVMRTGEAFWAKDHLFYLERHGFLEETYFDVSYDPVRDESGAVGGVFCIVSETTGRVQGERRLETLRELGFDALVRPDADVCAGAAAVLAKNPADVPFALVYLVDASGRSVTLGGATGLTPDDGRLGESIDLTSGAAKAGVLGEIIRTGKTLEPSPSVFVKTIPPTASSERVIAAPLLTGTQAAAVLVTGVSRHIALAGHYRDFFDLVASRISTVVANRNAYAEERRRAEALAELDRAKTVFFSNVSHEFRTPLSLLLGPLEEVLAAPAAAVSGETRQRVDVAHRNALRLLKLVNTLLDFSRIEAGRVQAAYEPLDIGTYTAELASAFRSLMERGGLRFVVECAPGLDDVFVDRAMWEKVVFNLLSNAFKYTFDGEVRVLVQGATDRVTLTVADTGTGIAADELPRIFERFRRVENARARTHEGTGIGLSLVSELVKLHGGAIDVQSEPGQGTTFTVTLPRGAGHLPEDRTGPPSERALPALGAAPYVEEASRWVGDADAESGAAPGPGSIVTGARVLVADDNADMREYLKRLLSQHWSVQAVTDGAAALAAARVEPPDLVLADAMMPGLDGFELLGALRADPRTRTVPVIMLSARAGEESRVEGFHAGADDYLVKPFSARELVARVNTHLQLAAARREFTVELERERATLETVLRQMPAGVIIMDAATGRYLFVNEQAMRILGVTEPADGADIFPDERVLHPDGRAYRREERPMVRSIRHGEIINDHQFRFVRPDSVTVTLTVSTAPVRDREGRITAAVVTFQDITEWRALVAREQAARAEADAANRAKDHFLAVLSHELRTPLNAILGWTRILKSARAAMADKVRAVEVIERNALRQSQLVNDLLDVSRIAAGKVDLDRFPVDLAVVVGDAVDAVRSEVDGKQLTLALDLDPNTGEVLADLLRLQQIVLNVLTNAIKFTPPGGRIDVRLARHGGMARLTVSDTGDGIDPSILPYVFEPFRQGAGSATTRTHEGLGLGLTIVRQLVALHGGTVRADSAGRGKGATLTVELPITAVRVPSRPQRAATTPGTELPPRHPSLEGLRILVVDDQRDARELLTLVLQQYGADTRSAASVAEALQSLGEGPVDVLVSDLALPGVDGYDLIAAVRANPEWRNMAAIAVTAYVGHAVRDRAADAGFDAHATKPLNPDDLVALITTLPRRLF